MLTARRNGQEAGEQLSLAASHAAPLARGFGIERHVANGGLGLFLDRRLAGRLSTPRRNHESRATFHRGLEPLVIGRALGVLVSKRAGARQGIGRCVTHDLVILPERVDAV